MAIRPGFSSPRFKNSAALEAVRKGQGAVKRGDRGAAVGLLREALHGQGLLSPTFDAETYAAVRAFQKAQGLAVDGVVGPTTLGVLDQHDAALLAREASATAAAAEPIYTVVDKDARIRSGPPDFVWDGGSRIPIFTRVEIRKLEGKNVQVVGLSGKSYKWTARSNLTTYHRDSPTLASVRLPPEILLQIDTDWPRLRRSLAGTHNRLGSLIKRFAAETKVDVAAVLAVWQIESAGLRHQPGRAIIRFENHHLFRRWGQKNERLYNQHFRHGGHNGVSGKPWRGHKYRKTKSGPFLPFHGKQVREYEVLELATKLAGEATALRCISIGGPQILISNHRLIGYRQPKAMYEAFQADERAHLLGFFDYCQQHGRRGSLIGRLRAKDWTGFASGYNGPGQADEYGALIGTAFREGERLFGA